MSDIPFSNCLKSIFLGFQVLYVFFNLSVNFQWYRCILTSYETSLCGWSRATDGNSQKSSHVARMWLVDEQVFLLDFLWSFDLVPKGTGETTCSYEKLGIRSNFCVFLPFNNKDKGNNFLVCKLPKFEGMWGNSRNIYLLENFTGASYSLLLVYFVW